MTGIAERCKGLNCNVRPSENGYCGRHPRQAKEEVVVRAFILELRALAVRFDVCIEASGGDDYFEVGLSARVEGSDYSWEVL